MRHSLLPRVYGGGLDGLGTVAQRADRLASISVVWEPVIKNGLRIDSPQGYWAERLSRRCWLRLCVVALKKGFEIRPNGVPGEKGCIMKQQEPFRVREGRSSDMRRHASLRVSMAWGGSGWSMGWGDGVGCSSHTVGTTNTGKQLFLLHSGRAQQGRANDEPLHERVESWTTAGEGRVAGLYSRPAWCFRGSTAVAADYCSRPHDGCRTWAGKLACLGLGWAGGPELSDRGHLGHN